MIEETIQKNRTHLEDELLLYSNEQNKGKI
jgi:hypothetical protein